MFESMWGCGLLFFFFYLFFFFGYFRRNESSGSSSSRRGAQLWRRAAFTRETKPDERVLCPFSCDNVNYNFPRRQLRTITSQLAAFHSQEEQEEEEEVKS